MANQMKISATYEDFPSVIEKVMVEIGTGAYQLIKPIRKETVVNGETVVEHLVEFQICDERMGYIYKYEFDKREMKQFINLLQRIQVQVNEAESREHNGNSSGLTCSRIQIK